MKLTNREKLPQPIVSAVEASLGIHDAREKWYEQNKISVTELIDSPRIRFLKAQHWDELEAEASEMLFGLYGTAIHAILEMADKSSIKEKRLETTIRSRSGTEWKLSGQFDRLSLVDNSLQDYKTMSVWEHILNGGVPRKSREEQLNLYAFLCKEHQIQVDKLEAWGFMKDWHAVEKKRKDNYPNQVQHYEMDLWQHGVTRDFIRDRLELHEQAAEYVCTREDMWTKDDVWAVIKEGQKRAMKGSVTKDKEYAHAYAVDLLEKGVEVKLEHRPGQDVRCCDRGDGHIYCDVAEFCAHAQEIKNGHEVTWD